MNKTSFKNSRFTGIILMLFCITLISEKTQSQNSIFGTDGFSISPKLGVYNWVESDDGFVGGIELDLLKNNFIYSIDYYNFDELVIFGPKPAEEYNQIGIMIGKYCGDNLFRFQYQAGISAFWGSERTSLIEDVPGILASDIYDEENFFTVGLVTKMGLKVVPLSFLSIGVDLQANFNFRKPVYMPLLSIEIGKLK